MAERVECHIWEAESPKGGLELPPDEHLGRTIPWNGVKGGEDMPVGGAVGKSSFS